MFVTQNESNVNCNAAAATYESYTNRHLLLSITRMVMNLKCVENFQCSRSNMQWNSQTLEFQWPSKIIGQRCLLLCI